MIDPPIDKLIKKADCRYALVCGVSKRAKQIAAQNAESTETPSDKPLSIAAKEIYEGDYLVVKE